MNVSRLVKKYIEPIKDGFDRTGNSDIKFLRQEIGEAVNFADWARINSDWFVSVRGGMLHMSGYYIEPERLDEEDWVLHLQEKCWFDANTFLPAYFFANTLQGRRVVSVQTTY